MDRLDLFATDNSEELGTVDLVLFCVKAYQTDQAMEIMTSAVSANTTIITLQNGIGIKFPRRERHVC